MMTTNKLTKTFASGSLAIGVLAGSVFAATSASAANILTWGQWTTLDPITGTYSNVLTAGDKKVTFVSENGFGADPLDEVALLLTGDEYDFVYDATTLGSPGANMNSGSFTYTIEVTDPNQYITAVALDSDVTATYGTVTKTFAEIPNVLVSVNGSSDPAIGFYPIAPIKKLTVTDTLAANPGEGLFSLNNAYKQTPEPGTILGLLAVGGLGMVSRFKKQK
ncbi:PEP-CTERM sorting domain-containing protein [Microcystis aeruginosa]|uniref:PEP-CTERM sorting domain-containing protein n=1 Tax=Microcystis aeruginosa TaxID=1126 RepID=UPI001881114A|nr:PEP-CTERM sorting domain-containing protein [Microcystis aeruginosa]MBE8993165.1 PEP-CTERM sorting domain-containing protein [Microcystis aeruginosa LEGE 91341]